MGTVIKLSVENRFGGCPKCKKHDGRLNIGRNHWFFCKKHRAKWFAGTDVFPDWTSETEEDWKQNEAFLDLFIEVDPFCSWKHASDEELLGLTATSPQPALMNTVTLSCLSS